MKSVAWVNPAGRLLIAAGLVFLLFWLGYASEPVFAALTRNWQLLLHALGLEHLLQKAQGGTSSEVTRRSLPAVASYALLYLAVCLLLLRVLLRPAARWWVAAQLYASAGALIVALLLLGKLSGNTIWLYQAARRLIDFLVSPLPVALLLALLWVPLRRPAPRR